MEMLVYYVYIYYSLFLLYFFLYRNHLTRSAAKVLLVWFLAVIAYSSALFLLTPLLDYDSRHYLYLEFLYVLAMFMYMRKNTQVGVHKQLFIFFVALQMVNFQAIVLMFTGSSFPVLLSEMSGYLFNVLGRLVLLLLLIAAQHRFFGPCLRQIKSRDMKGVWLIPSLFYVIENIVFQALYSGAEEMQLASDPLFYTVFISIEVVAFIVYAMLLRMLSGISKNAKMESEVTMLGRQLELQKDFYEKLQANISETKAARHDMRHHLSLIQTYINEGETTKLKSYVDEYTKSLPVDVETVYCENFAVNSIIRYYAEIARNKGIRVDVCLELPENISISDSDLCIVFGNCIENALEACSRLSGDKYIEINSKISGKLLVITIDNSFDGELIKDGEVFLSRKPAHDAVGISSVKAVARKYNEEARFEANGNVFCASITLRLANRA